METADGDFALTSKANLLRRAEPGSFRQFVLREMSAERRAVWERFPSAGKTKPTPQGSFPRDAKDTTWMRKHGPGSMEAEIRAAVRAGYDFSQPGVVVDVGGDAMLLAFLLQSDEALHGIAVARAPFVHKARLELEEEGVLERCEIREEPALERLPTRGACYILNRVLGKAQDAEARRLLASIASRVDATGHPLLDRRPGADTGATLGVPVRATLKSVARASASGRCNRRHSIT